MTGGSRARDDMRAFSDQNFNLDEDWILNINHTRCSIDYLVILNSEDLYETYITRFMWNVSDKQSSDSWPNGRRNQLKFYFVKVSNPKDFIFDYLILLII